MEFDFKGKSVIVTGASRGIGKAIAVEFAKSGAKNILVNYRSRLEEAEKVCKEIRSLGANAIALQADVAAAEDVRRMMRKARDEFGSVDILVNNASFEVNKYLWELGDEEFSSCVDVCLKSAFLTSKYVLPLMKKGEGRIINISSIHDSVPRRAASAYCSGKAGLLMLTKVLALELAEFGITVNAVSPGMTASDRNEALLNEDGSWKLEHPIVQANPTKRGASAEEAAYPVLFLASGLSGFTTGTTLYVDGAYMHNLCPVREAEDFDEKIKHILD